MNNQYHTVNSDNEKENETSEFSASEPVLVSTSAPISKRKKTIGIAAIVIFIVFMVFQANAYKKQMVEIQKTSVATKEYNLEVRKYNLVAEGYKQKIETIIKVNGEQVLEGQDIFFYDNGMLVYELMGEKKEDVKIYIRDGGSSKDVKDATKSITNELHRMLEDNNKIEELYFNALKNSN